MSSVSGNIAANARAASLSARVMAKRRSPTVIHMRDSSGYFKEGGAPCAVVTTGDPGVAC